MAAGARTGQLMFAGGTRTSCEATIPPVSATTSTRIITESGSWSGGLTSHEAMKHPEQILETPVETFQKGGTMDMKKLE